MSEWKIQKIAGANDLTPELIEGICELLPQLSQSSPQPSPQDLKQLADSESALMLVAIQAGKAVGCLTLIVYATLTGISARIEDVVVDQSMRGKGVGEALNKTALEEAAKTGAKYVDLTSKPERKAANELYKKLGFELRATNPYRKLL